MTSTPSDFAAPQKPFGKPQRPRKRRLKFLRVMIALMMREIASTETRTSLGFLWQVIDPVASIALLTMFFSILSRQPPLGTNFPLYYVTGVLPFNVFNTVASKVSQSVKFSKPLLEFPAVNIIDALVARFVLNFVIQCAIFIILTWTIIMSWHVQVNIDIPLAVEAMCLGGILALGVGTFNSVLFLAYPVYANIYSVLTRPLFLASGIFFEISTMPEWVQKIEAWNPTQMPVTLMRKAFFPGADASLASPFYLIMFSLVAGTLGLTTLRRFFRDALER